MPCRVRYCVRVRAASCCARAFASVRSCVRSRACAGACVRTRALARVRCVCARAESRRLREALGECGEIAE
eukprot:5711662-Pleurochrysis_carterae.AAC.8